MKRILFYSLMSGVVIVMASVLLNKTSSAQTRSSLSLDENLGAVSIELTPDDLREIDGAAAQIKVTGARYPEKLEALTGR